MSWGGIPGTILRNIFKRIQEKGGIPGQIRKGKINAAIKVGIPNGIPKIATKNPGEILQ